MHFHQEEESIKEKAPGAAAAEDPQEQSFFKKYVFLTKKCKYLIFI